MKQFMTGVVAAMAMGVMSLSLLLSASASAEVLAR